MGGEAVVGLRLLWVLPLSALSRASRTRGILARDLGREYAHLPLQFVNWVG